MPNDENLQKGSTGKEGIVFPRDIIEVLRGSILIDTGKRGELFLNNARREEALEALRCLADNPSVADPISREEMVLGGYSVIKITLPSSIVGALKEFFNFGVIPDATYVQSSEVGKQTSETIARHIFSGTNSLKLDTPALKFYLPFLPGYKSVDTALANTTDLVIASHPDDDILIGAHALSESLTQRGRKLAVIVLSNSPGTGIPLGFEQYVEGLSKKQKEELLTQNRWEEQQRASGAGHYAATISCGFSSDDIKGMQNGNPEAAARVRDTLYRVLKACPNLKNLYLHSEFDEHDTHRPLTRLSLEAVRMLDKAERPEKCLGVEVSSSLSWLPPKYRVYLEVENMKLAEETLKAYRSENVKNDYPRGMVGRAGANAIFSREMKGIHPLDPNKYYLIAVDYKDIVNAPPTMSLRDAMKAFKEKILNGFNEWKMRESELDCYGTIHERPDGKNVETIQELEPVETKGPSI